MAIPTHSADVAHDIPDTFVAVRLEAVEKRFGDVVAVDGVDLDVRDPGLPRHAAQRGRHRRPRLITARG